MTSKVSKNYLIYFLTGKVFKCVLTYNYQCKSTGEDYYPKCTKMYCKELHFLLAFPTPS